MELVRTETQQAYDRIRERIITLQLAPGSLINEQLLAKELDLSPGPLREALRLLAYEGLVVIPPGLGIYVAEVNLPDLEYISELRLELEGLSARLATKRATPDDLVVLEALCREHARIPAEDHPRLLDIDHRFHQAIARATQNKYLAKTLERYFGLSQRLWYLAIPQLGFLPVAVACHLEVVEAITAGDSDRAVQAMHEHVQDFYDRVRQILL